MKYRRLGRTGWQISEVSFGAWAIGGDWGDVSEADALKALHAAADKGVNFIDTADIYGAGRSEQIIGRFLKERSERIYVATKAGRRIQPHTARAYNRPNLTESVERSIRNLRVEALDILQLHCPPNEVYYQPETFEALDDLVKAGKLRYYGVSVRRVEEGLKALQYPNLQTVQIIFNIFRQRPSELFFPLAVEKPVGILARIPLASGLLSGRMSSSTQFPENDHRNFNREGQKFDVGETFSGVDFETGLEAVERLRALVPEGMSMAQFALRWILMFGAVTGVIPSSKNERQAAENTAASELEPLSAACMEGVTRVYDELVRPLVHQRW